MALPVVLLNPRAGAAARDPQRVREALQAAGWPAELRVVPQRELHAAALGALSGNAPMVVAAGGDGTVSAVASALIDSQTALGILPLGTLNHFAKDLRLPMGLPSAVQVLADGRARQVDVAEVNGRPFINNCSIGLYPHIVSRRDRQRQRLGRNKWVATATALLSVLGKYPLVRVVIDAPGQSLRSRTPIVFVGNNRYEVNLLNLGSRQALDGGQLCVYLVNAPHRVSLIAIALRMLFGRLKAGRDLRLLALPQARIETSRRRLRVALDGEVVRLVPPLDFGIRPGALKVMVPH
jgi:diacylglycerol kinase family enzyme